MADAEFTTPKNPHFTNIDRAPYELGYLLKQLPPDFSAYKPQTKDAQLIAAAVEQHAANGSNALLNGLASLGKLMFVAGTSDQYGIEKGDLIKLGGLIEHIAVEVQFLQEVEANFGRELEELSNKPTKGSA